MPCRLSTPLNLLENRRLSGVERRFLLENPEKRRWIPLKVSKNRRLSGVDIRVRIRPRVHSKDSNLTKC